jgi:putative thioredoxin
MDFGTRSAPGAAAADVIKDTTTAAFAKDVLEASRKVPVLVDFWAAWCGPCKQLTPIIEKVVKSYAGKVKLVKMNVDEHPTIPGQLRVQSLPTVYAFRDGRPVDGFMGLQGESQIKEFIDRILGPDAEAELADVLKSGEEALDAGDLQGAAEVFAAVLEEDKQNTAALAGLAKCYLKSGDIARAEQTIAIVAPAQQASAAIAGVRAAIELAKRSSGQASDTSALEQKVATDPADHQARIDLAVALAAKGDKSGAVEHLLVSFRRDRNWNEQAARKQLVQFFEAWGPKEPATVDGRKRLSALLFS